MNSSLEVRALVPFISNSLYLSETSSDFIV